MSAATAKATTRKSDSISESRPDRVERVRITAGPCERNESHTSTRIYKTDGRVRYCVCDECGATWTKSGAYADELREFASSLANSLDETQRRDIDGNSAIVMTDKDARDIASSLRKLASGKL